MTEKLYQQKSIFFFKPINVNAKPFSSSEDVFCYLVFVRFFSRDTYVFELLSADDPDAYSAMAFSFDPSMANSAAVFCYGNSVESHFLTSKVQGNQPQVDFSPPISNATSETVDGSRYCTFELEAAFTVEQEDVVLAYDLNGIPSQVRT